MPDSVKKKEWMKENSVMIPLKIMKRTEGDILSFLQTETEKTGMARNAIIKLALREYMERHKEEEKNNV